MDAPLPAEIVSPTEEVAADPAATAVDPFNGIPDIEAITLRACSRIGECLRDRGQSTGYEIAETGSWLAKRQLARTTYSGNFAHRAMLGAVFGVTGGNLSLRTMTRITSLRAAKQASDLVGSEPFMQAMPARITDKDDARTSKQTEAKVQVEVAGSNARMALAEGIRVGLSEGDCAVKVTWENDITTFPDKAEVAVDAEGVPIKTPKGKYIYRGDDVLAWVAGADGLPSRRAEMGTDGQPIEPLQPGETIQLRLKKDPSFVFTADPVYQEVDGLTQEIVHRKGLHFATLFTEDFIYPAAVPSLDDPACDIMVHRYDRPLESVVQEYRNAGYIDQRAILVAAKPESYAGQPLKIAGEKERTTSTQETITVYETYYRTWIRPPGGEPFEAWLFIVIEYKTKAPIYAQYLGRMKMKRPPFGLIRGLESVQGRAYGVGIFEKFNDRDVMIDCWFNRAALKSSMSNSITCAHMDGLEEIKEKREITFGSTKVYRIQAGSEYGANNPPIFRVNLNEMSDKEYELLEKLIQSGELEFGMTAAADGAQGSDSINNGTATAIRSIERTGNVLNEASEALQASDITGLLQIAVDAVLENMDAEEMVYVPGEESLANLNRDEIRNLPRNVRLLVTKAKGSDTIEIATAAKNTILEYYSLPLVRQKQVRDQFVEILKSLNVPDADDKLKEPTDEDLAAEAAAAGEEEPPNVSIALSDLVHLAPSERAQVLMKFYGIQAATPEELAMEQANKHAMEMEMNAAKKPAEKEKEAGSATPEGIAA